MFISSCSVTAKHNKRIYIYLSVPSLAIFVSAVLIFFVAWQTDRITEVDQRYTHATTVGARNMVGVVKHY